MLNLYFSNMSVWQAAKLDWYFRKIGKLRRLSGYNLNEPRKIKAEVSLDLNSDYYFIILVPVLPSKASTTFSIEVIRTSFPPDSIKSIAARIFGPMLPFGN